MTEIDFSKIRGFKGGQRDSFEELVCQLARREEHQGATEYRRIDGAGGDGGVEAYWIGPDQAKHGYQAKFFLRSGDIDWPQVDKSVFQALQTHPTLKSYTVAFPCSLTDRTGKAGKGKKGWEHWSTHVAAWDSHAKSLGISNVEFRAWTASDIVDRLAKPSAAGLRLFWFGGAEFTKDWFERHVEHAVALLDERFHPEDHVDVGLQSLFKIISRDPEIVERLHELVDEIKCAVVPRASTIGLAMPDDLSDSIETAFAAFIQIKSEFGYSAEKSWNSQIWLEKADHIASTIDDLQRWQWEQEEANESGEKEPRRRDALQSLGNSLAELDAKVMAFRSFVGQEAFIAERKRFAIVEGAAGSGKSHLFGHESQEALKRQRPVVLLLGQQFSEAEPWAQVSALLDMPGISADAFLGALAAAAEANRTRGLLLIDGVNEGIGSKFWRSRLAGFVARLKTYPQITCILSCRSEYVPHAFPTGLYEEAPRFSVIGFTSQQEQIQAARIYLDRRGIARPSTPWLAPEFVNPLFLRTTCLALARDGRSEFPKGLQGTKAALAYYLDSVGRHLPAGNDGTELMVIPTKQAVMGIARKMADLGTDHLTRAEALAIANEAFESHASPVGKSWLDVLHLAGLFRLDPHPGNADDDPMEPHPDVVRFCFQRFQDHLMGQALLKGIDDPTAAFTEGGRLAFMLDKGRIHWRWSGLFEALATLVPEIYAVELIDVLPGGPKKWWPFFIHYFIESVKWRAHDAFTSRSLELLNSLPHSFEDRTSLLIELSVSVGHPWNAELIHKNLMKRTLPERDAFWTVELNNMSDEEVSPVGRLMDWCLVGQKDITAIENQRLAGLMLCWFFTASNRAIRDKATKALASLFVARGELFPELLSTFASVDDLYVLERLLAAGFSACTHDKCEERVGSYAASVYKHIFNDGKPPCSILLRDYALGIVEMSDVMGSLPVHLELSKCRPPYKSPRPSFRITEEKLNKIADEAGGTEIVYSATGFMGDFAQYKVKPRISCFLAVPLSSDLPLSSEQMLAKFKREVVDPIPARRAAFAALEHLANPYIAGVAPTRFAEERILTEAEITLWTERVKAAEQKLLGFFNPIETGRYRAEAQKHLLRKNMRRNQKPEQIDTQKAQRWVANRAYQLGWTHERFPDDRSAGTRFSRDRPRIERIGKKYQWLALDELLCRLADNYWLNQSYAESPRRYEHPQDLGFHRDIDPTILTPSLTERTLSKEGPDAWIGSPWISLEGVTEERLAAWPFSSDPHSEFSTMVSRTDGRGKVWTVLYEHQSADNSYGKGIGSVHGLRQQEFRFIYSVQVPRVCLNEFVTFVIKEKSLSVDNWEPRDFTDAQFLGEAPWRRNWPQNRWTIDNWRMPAEIEFAFPVMEYHWESHLDQSLPDGARCHLPAPWLAKKLNLRPKSAGIWQDSSGAERFVSYRGSDSNQCVLVDSELLTDISDDGASVMVWLLIAERNTWPGGHNDNASWRRTEGICWPHGKGLRSRTWRHDQANGSSRLVLAKLPPDG